MVVSESIKNTITIPSSNFYSGYLSEENKNTNSKRCMHANVLCNFTYSSWNMEANQLFINRWMDKKDMVKMFNGILTIKRNEILPFVATQMHLEIITLNQVRQTKTIITW